MTPIQKKITAILVFLFIIALGIFRKDYFTWNVFTVNMYQLLIPFSLLAIFYLLTYLFRVPFALFLIPLFILELSSIILVNSGALKQFDSGKPLAIIRTLYAEYFRHILVYQTPGGVFDEHLHYRLTPGNFNFSNYEYSNSFQVNSQGFRDQEGDLEYPEIIFLGDSFAMGWGVNQEQCFPELFEKDLGKKTLNLAISSFGTARSYLALQRQKLDSTKLLFLQYCTNDEGENRVFVQNNFALPSPSLKSFNGKQMLNRLNGRYYAFKYSFSLFKYGLGVAINKMRGGNRQHSKNKDQAMQDFFKILSLIQEIYTGPIVLFNIESHKTTSEVYLQFKDHLNNFPNSNLHLFNASSILSEKDYYLIDDHLNPIGHQKIAKALNQFIQEKELIRN